jgi:F-type H+-transporting ATPase subunit c
MKNLYPLYIDLKDRKCLIIGGGMGVAGGKAFEAIARQPEVGGDIRTLLFITLAFIETLTIYGLLIAFMLVGKI